MKEQQPQLIVKPRAEAGSRAVRRLRRDGFIPAVIYGKSVKPTPVLVNQQEFIKFLHARAGERGLLRLRVEKDGKPMETPVLMKQVQHDPVNGSVTHIDFQAITLTEEVRVKVPIVLKGEPAGVKRDGGVLEHFLREVEVECLPTAIPDKVEHDISELTIGTAVHVKDLIPSAGVRITADPEAVIASVQAPKEEKLEEAAEAVTEPEVIREKKPEGEAEGEAAAESKAEAKKEEKKEEKK